MLPPLDLTGRRFGRLVITGRAPDIVSASGKSSRRAWVCLCDCGRTEILPDRRIPHCPANMKRSDALEACTECASMRTCAVCGRAFVSRLFRATCSDVCAQLRRRGHGLDYYYRRTTADPTHNQRRGADRRERAKTDPALAARLATQEALHQVRRRERMATDPAYAEHMRQRARERYATQAAEVQARRRARRLASPEIDAAMREWARQYHAKRAAEINARRKELLAQKIAQLAPDEREAFLAARRIPSAEAKRRYRQDPERRARMNASAQASWERRLEAMTPEELAAHIERRREYERRRMQDPVRRDKKLAQNAAAKQRRALRELMQTADDLMSRINEDTDDDEQ